MTSRYQAPQFQSFADRDLRFGSTFVPIDDLSLDPDYTYLVGSAWHLFIGVTPKPGNTQVWETGSPDDRALWSAVAVVNREAGTNLLLGKVGRPSLGSAGAFEPLTEAEVACDWVQAAASELPDADKQARRAAKRDRDHSYYRWHRTRDIKHARLQEDVVLALLSHWEGWATGNPPRYPTKVAVRAGGVRRKAWLLDDQKAKYGYYELPDGPLTLWDERLRAHAILVLKEKGVEVAPGFDPDTIATYADVRFEVGRDPRQLEILGGMLSKVRTRHGEVHTQYLVLGTYCQASGDLVVRDSRFARQLAQSVRRNGMQVASISIDPGTYDPDEILGGYITSVFDGNNPLVKTWKLDNHSSPEIPNLTEWRRDQLYGAPRSRSTTAGGSMSSSGPASRQ